DRDAVFLGQGLSQREFEDILDSRQLFPVVCKPIIVLYATIDAAVQANNLVCIQVDPSRLGSRIAFFGAKSSVAESLYHVGDWSVHHGLPSCGAPFEGSPLLVGLLGDFCIPTSANF